MKKTPKFKAVTKAKLSKYNEGFEKFFETFNKDYQSSNVSVSWEEEGKKLKFESNDKRRLEGAMSDHGFGGYIQNIEEV